jgi:hypothetical protein
MKHKIEQVCEICVDNNNVAEDSGLVFWDVTLCFCVSSFQRFEGGMILKMFQATCAVTQCNIPEDSDLEHDYFKMEKT